MNREKGTTLCRPRSERTAYGISDCESQIAKLKSEIWNLRFLAKRGVGTGPVPARGEARSALTLP